MHAKGYQPVSTREGGRGGEGREGGQGYQPLYTGDKGTNLRTRERDLYPEKGLGKGNEMRTRAFSLLRGVQEYLSILAEDLADSARVLCNWISIFFFLLFSFIK